MVVTVEPGIYFSLYVLQYFYLPSPVHSRYINTEVLQRYLPVGGVRIEDNILITSKGYENLTTAPKGEAMLDVIRNGKSNTSITPSHSRKPLGRSYGDEESPLRRAPGIPSETPELIPGPPARAATMPTEVKQRGSVDFEPFNGPSLFSNFRRSMTTDENIQRWRQSRERVSTPETPAAQIANATPVCGESVSGVEHVYMGSAVCLGTAPRARKGSQGQLMCKNCAILVQTLDRLRQNLNTSTQSSPTLERSPVFERTARATSAEKRRMGHLAEELRAVEVPAKSAPHISEHREPDVPQLHRLHDRSASPVFRNGTRALPCSIPAPLFSTVPHLDTSLYALPSSSLHNQQSMRVLPPTGWSKEEEGAPPMSFKKPKHQAENNAPFSAIRTRSGTAKPTSAPPVASGGYIEKARKDIEDLSLL